MWSAASIVKLSTMFLYYYCVFVAGHRDFYDDKFMQQVPGRSHVGMPLMSRDGMSVATVLLSLYC